MSNGIFERSFSRESGRFSRPRRPGHQPEKPGPGDRSYLRARFGSVRVASAGRARRSPLERRLRLSRRASLTPRHLLLGFGEPGFALAVRVVAPPLVTLVAA